MLAAVKKLDDLPAFGNKDSVKESLTARANQQAKVLGERDDGNDALTRKKSEARRIVLECAVALLALKSELAKRFPFQTKYIASFFLNVAKKKKKKGEEDAEEVEVDEEADDDTEEPGE